MPNWDHVWKEISQERDDPKTGESGIDKVRLRYLMQLHEHVGRNVICYYSGWLSKPRTEGVDINDEDKNGFMLCVHKMDKSKGLDLFLHTPGGSGEATASLVDYLRKMFGNNIRAFIPQIAMSAGTLIACSCKEIFMGKHSNLGPVDPQINGIPAYAVIHELDTAYNEMIANPQRQFVWNPILNRYTPSFVQQCQWAIQNGKQFIADFLASNMFANLQEPEKSQRLNKAVERLTDLSLNKGHNKHFHADECKDIGLEIRDLEDPSDRVLQDLVLTVHHCYMLTLSNSPAFKIIENHTGKKYVKVVQQAPIFLSPAMPQQPAQ